MVSVKKEDTKKRKPSNLGPEFQRQEESEMRKGQSNPKKERRPNPGKAL